MKKQIMMASVAALLLAGCSNEEKPTNPLFSEYSTPYEIPPFSEITVDHLREAILKGIEEEKQELQEITENAEAPTFENTILRLDNMGALLRKAQNVFGPLSSSDSNEEFRALEKEISPLTSELSNSIYLNDKLFGRVKQLYEAREGKGYEAAG